MGKLDGKVAIVTGAVRGLGRAYAKRLAGLGAKVAVADLNLRSYEEFEAEGEGHDRREHGCGDRGVEWNRRWVSRWMSMITRRSRRWWLGWSKNGVG